MIQKYPRNILNKISPSAAKLKPFINFPLIYTNFLIGSLAAMSIAFVKFAGEIVTNGLMHETMGLCIFLTLASFFIAIG